MLAEAARDRQKLLVEQLIHPRMDLWPLGLDAVLGDVETVMSRCAVSPVFSRSLRQTIHVFAPTANGVARGDGIEELAGPAIQATCLKLLDQ